MEPFQHYKQSSSKEEFDAFFYTLVSNDTREVYFTSKRQQFLIDQGYSYKVISKLIAAGCDEDLLLNNIDDQITLLASVLHASEEMEAVEETDGLIAEKGKASAVRKVGGSMAALSGAKGIKYMEYHTGAGKGKLATKAKAGEKKLAKLRKLK